MTVAVDLPNLSFCANLNNSLQWFFIEGFLGSLDYSRGSPKRRRRRKRKEDRKKKKKRKKRKERRPYVLDQQLQLYQKWASLGHSGSVSGSQTVWRSLRWSSCPDHWRIIFTSASSSTLPSKFRQLSSSWLPWTGWWTVKDSILNHLIDLYSTPNTCDTPSTTPRLELLTQKWGKAHCAWESEAVKSSLLKAWSGSWESIY